METAAGFFLEEDSEEYLRVQKSLTSGQFRCNLMMVRDAEQAAAMLRHECGTRAPDLLLIFGGLHDGRAAALLEQLAADPRLTAIRYPVLVDSREARQEFRKNARTKSVSLGDFSLAELERRLAGGAAGFWWVMARFS